MRQINLLVTLFVAMMFGACVQYDELINGGPYTIINVGVETPTRTALGEKGDDGIYPIHWVESDRLVVNGGASTGVTLNEENPSRAGFKFSGILEHPYNITFPYTEGSSCSASKPTVVFPAEQSYVEGSFDLNAAPMYGYAAATEDSTPLTHLVGVLRLPFKATAGSPVIKSITITPETEGVTLAGEYAVDCKTGALTVVEGTTSPHIIYSMSEGVTLSTSEAVPFFITLPAGSFGRCMIAVTDMDGKSMILKWTANNVKAGCVREFKAIPYTATSTLMIDAFDVEQDDAYLGANNNIEDLIIEEDDILVDYIPGQLFGFVKDSNGNPLSNIAVSDGFKVITTDANGYYSMEYNSDSYYVMQTIPAEYEISVDEYGRPAFFKLIDPFTSRYDFTLTPLAGGAEEEFLLFGFADPQTGSDEAVVRFRTDAAPKIKKYVDEQKKTLPCYGITLGDIISMGGSVNEEYMFAKMRDEMHADKMGMPIFQVFGNHDNCFMNQAYPAETNARSSTFNLRIQRPFEEALGPVNYSFDRGNVHIVAMRDVQWVTNTSCATANTNTAFTKEQYDWLVADLEKVSRSKMIILCVHIPLGNSGELGDGTYRQEVLYLLDEFAEAHILSGHTHYQRNYDHTLVSTSDHKIYEHMQAAVNGASWSSNINGDGAPNGFGVYHASGATMKDWYYIGYPEGMNTRDYQMRLYRGNTITGAETPTDSSANKNGTKGYYQFGYDENTLLANVFNSDPAWEITVYEDGNESGKMTNLFAYHWAVTYDELVGSGTLADPWRPDTGVECGRDFWAAGILCGHLGYNSGSLFYKHCYTMWKYTLKNKDAKIEVRAKDRKGNTYTCSTITDGRDWTYALYEGEQGDDTDDEI